MNVQVAERLLELASTELASASVSIDTLIRKAHLNQAAIYATFAECAVDAAKRPRFARS